MKIELTDSQRLDIHTALCRGFALSVIALKVNIDKRKLLPCLEDDEFLAGLIRDGNEITAEHLSWLEAKCIDGERERMKAIRIKYHGILIARHGQRLDELAQESERIRTERVGWLERLAQEATRERIQAKQAKADAERIEALKAKCLALDNRKR